MVPQCQQRCRESNKQPLYVYTLCLVDGAAEPGNVVMQCGEWACRWWDPEGALLAWQQLDTMCCRVSVRLCMLACGASPELGCWSSVCLQ
jgi:hypothetical protein